MLQMLNCSNNCVRRTLLLLAVLLVAGCSGSPEQRAQGYYEQGTKYLAQKDYVKAGIEFKNAVQWNKELVVAWRGLAEVEEHSQNWAGLAATLRRIGELDPKDIDTKLKLARLLLLGNALDDALKLVDAALELDNRHTRALALKAAILLRRSDSDGAIREAQKALEIDSANTEATIVLAAEKMARGDHKSALEILNRAPAADKSSFGIQLFKLQLYERLGDLKQVESLLTNLVETYPPGLVFRRQLVKLYLDQKRLDDAERELRTLAAADENNVQAGLDIVRFLNVVKGPDAAKQEILTRINAGKQAFPYQIALAQFYLAQGKGDESIELLKSLISNVKAPEDVLTAQNTLAGLYIGTKKFEAAEELVSDILRKDSRNITGLKFRALIRMDRGQLDPAVSDLRQALNDQPRATDLMLLLAVAYERMGSIDLADKQYAEATRASNFNARIGLTYVSFLGRRGNSARADDILTELARRWPNNVEVLSAWANTKLSNRDWAGAEQIANSLRRIGNAKGIADQILGDALSGASRFEESIQVLQGAYNEAPTAVRPMVALVRGFVRAKQTDKATAFLQDVLKKNPANAEALVLLGSTQLLNNAPEQALKSFKTAIDKQPKDIVGYRALANLHLQQKKFDEAIKVLRAGLKELPRNFVLRMTLASAFELKGDYDAAISEYDSLLKDQPGSMVVANNLASLLTDHRTDEASLDRAYSLVASLQKSPIPHFKDTVGWVQYRRGNFKDSTSLLEQAATELPSIATVRYHLGMSYIAIGQNTKAVEQLEKARTLASNDNSLQEKIRAGLKQAGVN